jgi:hypothetical protein
MVNIGYTRKACQNNNPNYAQVLLKQYTKGPVDYQVKEESVQFAAVCLLFLHGHDQSVPTEEDLQEVHRSKLHR